MLTMGRESCKVWAVGEYRWFHRNQRPLGEATLKDRFFSRDSMGSAGTCKKRLLEAQLWLHSKLSGLHPRYRAVGFSADYPSLLNATFHHLDWLVDSCLCQEYSKRTWLSVSCHSAGKKEARGCFYYMHISYLSYLYSLEIYWILRVFLSEEVAIMC